MITLPTLYKKTSTGKVQQWTVGHKGDQVITTYGQTDGKQQTTSDTVVGKNIGKKNETSAEEQASLKAKQLWDKKIKSRYVETLVQAEEGTSSVEGIKPMLAFPIEKKLPHVVWPALAQAKLDGLRCLARITVDEAILYYRKGAVIPSLPHIAEELYELFSDSLSEGEVMEVDGELYNHKYKHNFNKLKSIIKRDDVHPEHTEVQYHMYDHIDDNGYEDRMDVVNSLIDTSEYLKRVPYKKVNSMEEITGFFHEVLEQGYEGAMYRNPNMGYDNKPERSVGLLKVKVMEDEEFIVTGVKEGTGKLQGTAGSIECKSEEGYTFYAKLKAFEDGKGKRVETKEDYQARCLDWFENIDSRIGKELTVQFQGRTPKKYNNKGERIGGRLPRFPVALRIREGE